MLLCFLCMCVCFLSIIIPNSSIYILKSILNNTFEIMVGYNDYLSPYLLFSLDSYIYSFTKPIASI